MYVVRNVFKCKPGQAKNLIEKFKKATEVLQQSDAVKSERILVDEVATFWTVVIETEVEDLTKFSQAMQEYGSKVEVRQAMEGYMELVDGGYREIFRVA
jgi:hypothetical protein